MAELPDEGHIQVVPDWVCEVLSPSTRSIDHDKKLPIDARLGVACVWLVDPIGRTVEVHQNRQVGQYRNVQVFADVARARITPFEAIEIELAAMWSPPRPGATP